MRGCVIVALCLQAAPSVELRTATAIPPVGIEHVRDLALYGLLGPSLIQAPHFALVKVSPTDFTVSPQISNARVLVKLHVLPPRCLIHASTLCF